MRTSPNATGELHGTYSDVHFQDALRAMRAMMAPRWLERLALQTESHSIPTIGWSTTLSLAMASFKSASLMPSGLQSEGGDPGVVQMARR